MHIQRPPRGQACPPIRSFVAGQASVLYYSVIICQFCDAWFYWFLSSFRHCQKMQCIAPNSKTLLFFGNMLIIIKPHFWFKLLERACCGAKPHKTCPTWFQNIKFFKKNYKSEKWKILCFNFWLKNYTDRSDNSPGGAGNDFRAQKTVLKFFDFRT